MVLGILHEQLSVPFVVASDICSATIDKTYFCLVMATVVESAKMSCYTYIAYDVNFYYFLY